MPIIRFVSQPRALEDVPRYVFQEEGGDGSSIARKTSRRNHTPAGRATFWKLGKLDGRRRKQKFDCESALAADRLAIGKSYSPIEFLFGAGLPVSNV